MTTQDQLDKMLSKNRFSSYLATANGDTGRAEELYRWNAELSAQLHYQIGLFEVITRNAMDKALRIWCQQNYSTEDWTSDILPTNEIHALIAKNLQTARKQAATAQNNRRLGHPRKHESPNHNDVMCQLTMGAWSTLLGETHTCNNSSLKKSKAQDLWRYALSNAFPEGLDVHNLDPQREVLGKRFQRITDLRNRVAHHENLLEVKVKHRLNDMVSVLSAIDTDTPKWFIEGSKLRTIARKDPRKGWERGYSRAVAWP